MPLKSILLRSLLVAVFVFAVAWRLPWSSEEKRHLWNENDCLYHLFLIETCLEQGQRVEFEDAKLHMPDGLRVHWLAPHTLFYVALAHVCGLGGSSREALVRFVSVIPPLLGLLATVLSFLIMRRLGLPKAWVPPLLGCGVVVGFASTLFAYGHIDHHLFIVLGLLMLVLSRLTGRVGLWVFGFWTMLAMAPEATLYATLVLAAFGCVEFIHFCRDATAPSMGWSWFLAPGGAAALAFLGHVLGQVDPLPVFEFRVFYFSLFQVIWLLVFGCLLYVMDWSIRRSWMRRSWVKTVGLGLGGLIVLAVMVGLLALTGHLEFVLNRLTQSGRLAVREERSPLGPGITHLSTNVLAIAVLVIVYVVGCLRAVMCGENRERLFFWLLLAGFGILGLLEWRHFYEVTPLLLVGLALLVDELGSIVNACTLPRVRTTMGITLIGLGGLGFALPVAEAFRLRLQTGSSGFSSRIIIGQWFAEEGGTDEPASKNWRSVFAPWDYGHHIRVIGDQGVVVDPINTVFPGESMSVQEKGVAFLSAEDETVWRELLDRFEVRYVVLKDPILDLITLPVSPFRFDDLYFERAFANRPLLRPEVFDLPVFRLYYSLGLADSGTCFQLRLMSPQTQTVQAVSPEGTVSVYWVPSIAIYERKLGATIRGRLPQGCSEAVVKVSIRGKNQIFYRELTLKPDQDGQITFRTGLPAPHSALSFTVPQGYHIRAGTHETWVKVSQADVDSGAALEWNMAGAQDGDAALAPAATR